MKNYLKMIYTLFKMNIRSIKSYRHDFIIGNLCFLLQTLINIFVTLLVFYHLDQIQDWSIYQILFLQSYYTIVFGIDHVFFDNLWNLAGNEVARGQYEKYLSKPVSPLFLACCYKIDLNAIGTIVVGIVTFIVSIIFGNMHLITAFILLMIPFSLMIVMSLKIIITSLSFKFGKVRGILYISSQIKDFTKYPLSLYSKFIQIILFSILPYGLAIYIPVINSIKNTNICYFLFIIIFSFICLFISITIWKHMQRKYESTGS